MNQEQITSIIRQLLLVVGGYFGLDGLVNDPTTLQAIAGGLAVVIAGVWALWDRTDKSIVTSAAHKVPVSETSQEKVGIANPVKPTT